MSNSTGMQEQLNKYHFAALQYLENYYQEFADETFYFSFSFIKGLVSEARKIAKSENLEGSDYLNVLMIVCFRFAGVTNFLAEEDIKYKLLRDFAGQINLPSADLEKVETSIRNNVHNIAPANQVELVAWDAIRKKEKNLIGLVKRIQKIQPIESKHQKEGNKQSPGVSSKETDEFFKIAFRNYVHLISVADSKAGLLINVNSIIISVVIAFVVGRSDKYPFLLLPSFVLMGVAFITILLSILASRPQGNRYIHDKESKSYQTFFFGSFDLIGTNFFKADLNSYLLELDAFFKQGKERVYKEMYKETFHVRKVLSKKFSYLAVAYWVFLSGLFVSILIFFINTHRQ